MPHRTWEERNKGKEVYKEEAEEKEINTTS